MNRDQTEGELLNFSTYRREAELLIDRQLEHELGSWLAEVQERFPRLVGIAERFADSCRRGKRVRGALVCLGYEIAGGIRGNDIALAAASMEVLHTSLLVHDDIMDNSPLRRGVPTIHAGIGGDRGVGHAICLGDIGFFLACDMIARSAFPDGSKIRATQIVNRTLLDTGLGQMWDIELPWLENVPQEQEILGLFEMKTARYTVTGPLQLGAALGGADESRLVALEEFGQELGIAFQIQDDILGTFSDEAISGKPATSDIAEGKNTLLYLHALRHATADQGANLKRVYGAGAVSDDDASIVRDIFVDTGALDESRAQARTRAQRAQEMIPSLTDDPNIHGLLRDLCTFLIERRS